MNFEDKGNDYFLHNFKEEDSPQTNSPNASGRTESPDSSSDTNGPNGFSFPQEASDTRGIIPKKKKRHGWRWFFFILFVALCATVYIRYFIPYATESRTTGFVTRVEKRGIIFKTFEGEMISQSQLTDTARIYSRDFFFSIPDDSIARIIQSYEGTGRPVTITCKRYFGSLPWRGATNTIATAVEPGQTTPATL